MPEDIKERAVIVFKSAISQKFLVKDSIEKVQKEALSEIENVYKGKRFKVHNFRNLVKCLSFIIIIGVLISQCSRLETPIKQALRSSCELLSRKD